MNTEREREAAGAGETHTLLQPTNSTPDNIESPPALSLSFFLSPDSVAEWVFVAVTLAVVLCM